MSQSAESLKAMLTGWSILLLMVVGGATMVVGGASLIFWALFHLIGVIPTLPVVH